MWVKFFDDWYVFKECILFFVKDGCIKFVMKRLYVVLKVIMFWCIKDVEIGKYSFYVLFNVERYIDI